MRYVSRIWNLDWVQPYLSRLDAADALDLNGGEGNEAALLEEAQQLQRKPVDNSERQAETSNGSRAAAIAAARERALLRRRQNQSRG
jgi:hypothetical protein